MSTARAHIPTPRLAKSLTAGMCWDRVRQSEVSSRCSEQHSLKLRNCVFLQFSVSLNPDDGNQRACGLGRGLLCWVRRGMDVDSARSPPES